MNFREWISDVSSNEWLIYIKRLSANDTGATKGHQAGVYFPKTVLATVFPSIDKKDIKNPDAYFKAKVESDDVEEQTLRVIYYNNRFSENIKGGRNEKRITCWKDGASYTPLQDPEKTGSISIFAFNANATGDSEYMRAWVCHDLEEESYIEDQLGEISSQDKFFDYGDVVFSSFSQGHELKAEKYPEDWNNEFPKGIEIIDYLFKQGLHADLSPDKRILKRRDHEFNLFKLIERHHTLPLIEGGFNDVEEFIKLANSISNRRKSRSGKSLELHLENIFREQQLLNFGTQCKTEGNKRPDFLFPDCGSYHDKNYASGKLRMLAVKTTVKDRWRQVLNEAKKIDGIHLFTLQQGVSENQFSEMQAEGVQLVVPAGLHKTFPKTVQPNLMTLNSFIENTKLLYS
jgi:type II restriction enzyme